MTEPARRLRVLTLIDTISCAGGAENLAVRLAAGLDQSRFESYFCASRSGDGSLPAELSRSGVPLLVLGRRSTLSLHAWRPLFQLLRRERIDVLHAHKFGSNLWGAVVGTAAQVPVIVAHEHSWAGEAGPVRRTLDRRLIAPTVDAFIAVCEADAQQMTSIAKIDPRVVHVIPNGVATWPAGLRSLRQELEIPEGAPVVCFIGRLAPIKALDVLVEAAALTKQSLPELRVLIAGSGEEEQRLRSLVADRGLSGNVLFLGAREDVGEILETSDVSVLCSDSEGMPLSILEAMAAGKPVVSTRVGGVPEIVEDGATGILVPPRDPRALSGALTRLLTDPGLRARLGSAGQQRHRERYDLAVTIGQIEQLYLELAGDRTT